MTLLLQDVDEERQSQAYNEHDHDPRRDASRTKGFRADVPPDHEQRYRDGDRSDGEKRGRPQLSPTPIDVGEVQLALLLDPRRSCCGGGVGGPVGLFRCYSTRP